MKAPTTGRKHEGVAHPPHYNAHPSGVECIDIVEALPFNLGNAIKYLWRADEKGRPVEDLEKALFYLRREQARAAQFNDAGYRGPLRDSAFFYNTLVCTRLQHVVRAHESPQGALLVVARALLDLIGDPFDPREASPASFFLLSISAVEVEIARRKS